MSTNIETIIGLLLCSDCENQLKVEVYNKEGGFYKVYPCTYCETVCTLEEKCAIVKGKEDEK